MDKKYTLNDFRYDLPERLTALKPAQERDGSRLMALDRRNKTVRHEQFSDIAGHFNAGDLLVFNDAKVINARIFFMKETGARFEIVLSRRLDSLRWLVIARRAKRLKSGHVLISEKRPDINIEIIDRIGEEFEIQTSVEFTETLLKEIGNIPLPPYINRDADSDDSERYQTVYSSKPGAVASPTAGLHFTGDILDELEKAGARSTFLTLYVGQGTFSPVRTEDISLHRIHTEAYYLPEETADLINQTRAEGGRIIAVGTTSLRVLESTFEEGANMSGGGQSTLFIYPPYKIKSVDALITNFHTPESTLLMLVAAFADYDFIMKAYREAVEKEYRFFSYGDCMLIE